MAYEKKREQHYSNFQGVNQKGSKYTLDNAQATNLRNLDFFIPNAWTKRPGYTQMITTGTSGPINSLYEYEKLSGASYMMASSDSAVFYMQSNALTVLSSGYSGQPFDFTTFQDILWFANGQTFLRWDGTTLIPFSLDPGYSINVKFGTSGAAVGAAFLGIPEPVDIRLGVAKVRDDGYIGPLNITETVGTLSNPTFLAAPFRVVVGVTTVAAVGCTGWNYYINVRTNPTGFTGTYVRLPDPNPDEWVSLDKAQFHPGVTLTILYNSFNFNSAIKDFTGIPFDFSSTYHPKYIELHQDRMFFSGFSNAPSLNMFSEISNAEMIEIDSNFETRTNDGDIITGTISFNDELVIFKIDSFHKLVGNSPETYQQVQLSTQYGCLNNRAVVQYNNILMFLDKSGIVEYNGANWQIVSTPVEDIFRRMNYSAALTQAVAVHYKFRNQVWFGIPIDGSTRNNITVVYDYLLNAWTFFDGFTPSAFTRAKQALPFEQAWMGTYSGMIYHFSSSFLGDNGQGITTYALTKFDSPDGANVQNMYRQIFIDQQSNSSGLTGTINVRVFRNYDASTVQATFAIYQNAFQTRSDFGVQGKSIAFDFMHFSASLPITYYGYTVRRRYLRDV